MQLQFDTPTTAETVRDRHIAQVEHNANPDWLTAAHHTVAQLAAQHHEFTTDDMWQALAHIDAPHEPRAMGAVMVEAARRGLITKTDRVTNSRRTQCHARPIAIWKSNL
jgi:hypothetical protein